MAPNDTQPQPPKATGSRNRLASITPIGDVLRGRRNRAAPDEGTAPQTAPPLQLELGEILGYFAHSGHIIQVQLSASESLWLRERPYDAATGALPDFAAYRRQRYDEFGYLTWPHRTLQFTYSGGDVEPAWLPLPSPSLADLLRKALSLYNAVMKDYGMLAADNIVPNPAPRRYDPNRRGRHAP